MAADAYQTSFRFVDAHVHHWDPANLEWYPHLAPDFDVSALGVDGADGMKRRYLADEYLRDARPWGLVKYVHVNATSAPKAYLAEAEWLADLGGPLAGVIGTVDLDQDPDDVVADFLAEQELVYDFVVHPQTMLQAVEVIEQHPTLTVVIEHLGWPTATGPDERERWKSGMRALAECRATVTCKLSRIAMATHTLNADTVRPWVDEALECFGVERCMIGSNFPVDGVFGGFDQLMDTYRTIVRGHGEDAVEAVFAANTERVYRI